MVAVSHQPQDVTADSISTGVVREAGPSSVYENDDTGGFVGDLMETELVNARLPLEALSEGIQKF